MVTVATLLDPPPKTQASGTANADGAFQVNENALADVFAHFREAAGSLELSYARLRDELSSLRQQLDQTHRDLESEREQTRRQQALVEVSAMLAHEVRNPLASLELFAGWLMESELRDEQQAWVRHMQAGLRTLSATVHNVLHWRHPCPINLVALDFGPWLHHVAGFLSPLAQQANVRLVVENHLDGITAPADPHALQQMTLNLALNAFRAMPAGGAFRMRGKVMVNPANNDRQRERREVCLEFEDSGPGIATEDVAKIFQAGFTTALGSPGLGLAVCRTIVELHGGRLNVRNLPQGGACFGIRLPLSPRTPERAERDSI